MKKQNFRTAGFLSMAMLLFFLCGLFFAHPVSAENAAAPEASVSKEAAAAVKPQPKESLSAKIAADTRVIPEGSAFPPKNPAGWPLRTIPQAAIPLFVR